MDYSLRQTLNGRQVVVFGGTGFLGKVWLTLLLSRFPDIGHVFLVVRPKAGQGVEERFFDKVLGAEVFEPLRRQWGEQFQEFIAKKVTPMAGDISMPLCGIEDALRARMRGRIDAVVNVAGIVDFDPPLDEALVVNAFGCQNLVALARDLGAHRVLHTSTCYTAGSRTGPIAEEDPRAVPFPRAFELDVRDWSPDREIAECLDVIEQARHRAGDAFRQSAFLATAKENLRRRDEPEGGPALERELAKVRRKYVEAELAALGMERARYWGWPNTYTYTKSIGEQIVASSGLDFCIVRPAIVESTLEFPFPGWNEGINTSAPFIFLIREGGLQVPGSSNNLDFIPCDLVCSAITLALGELIDGSHKPVYQAAASDTNPCTMARFFELSGLYKRQYYRRTGRGGPVLAELQAHFESAFLSKREYEAFGPKRLAEGADLLANGLAKLGLSGVQSGLRSFSRQQRRLGRVMDTFLPFVAEYQYIFETKATRGAYERLGPAERTLVPFEPDRIDWRSWFLEIHAPALEKRVFPLMEQRLKRAEPPPAAHESLVSLFQAATSRFQHHTLFQLAGDTGLSRLSYLRTDAHVRGLMRELRRLGVGRGARVVLAGKNSPAWAVAMLATLGLGATLVPVDPTLALDELALVARRSEASAVIAPQPLLADALLRLVSPVGVDLSTCLDFEDESEPFAEVVPEDLALLLFTSGTVQSPKGVMLSHRNVSSLVAALGPLFPLGPDDRLVSVLPLHHTFELTCGFFLPVSRGATITYLSEVNGERIAKALKDSQATALIGVPALWEALERRILERVNGAGPLAAKAFDFAVEVSQTLAKATGLDVGRLLFRPLHAELGGKLRYLVSGGARLPEETHALFQGLGLFLSEGYGLTEASPVLTVQRGGPRSRAGVVGAPVGGVELKIVGANPEGVGEVWARGPGIMQGYLDDPDQTQAALSPDGWLKTGDLGRLDGKGRLTLVGRAKEVVIGPSGENLYPDDIERRLGELNAVEELSVFGVLGPQGGEQLCLVATPAAGYGEEEALGELKAAYERLIPRERPSHTLLHRDPLPRSKLGKVQRRTLREFAERQFAERAVAERSRADSRSQSPVSDELALVFEVLQRRVRPGLELGAEVTLRGDLALDSLSSLELLREFEAVSGRSLDPERFAAAVTLGDVATLLVRPGQSKSRTERIEVGDAKGPLEFPAPVSELGRRGLRYASKAFFDLAFSPEVRGRHNIPHNRPAIIFANHTSHLDAPLIVEALGSYGDNVAVLAARDYFFEGSRLKQAFFRQMTPLVPVEREASLSSLLGVAREHLDAGRSVLVFPEGTRSPDGRLKPFKQGIGQLVLERPTDVLPVWIDGAYQAMPRGARMVRPGKLKVTFGPVLDAEKLIEIAQGATPADTARELVRILSEVLEKLGRGEETFAAELAERARQPGDLQETCVVAAPLPESTAAEPGLRGVFRELEARFDKSAVEAPLSYYFSLGEERWTLIVSPTSVQAVQGKVRDDVDCVLKTTPDMFERIVRSAYVPGPGEFLSGSIKTSNLNQLLKMQSLFRLTTPSSEFWARHGASRTSGGAER